MVLTSCCSPLVLSIEGEGRSVMDAVARLIIELLLGLEDALHCILRLIAGLAGTDELAPEEHRSLIEFIELFNLLNVLFLEAVPDWPR